MNSQWIGLPEAVETVRRTLNSDEAAARAHICERGALSDFAAEVALFTQHGVGQRNEPVPGWAWDLFLDMGDDFWLTGNGAVGGEKWRGVKIHRDDLEQMVRDISPTGIAGIAETQASVAEVGASGGGGRRPANWWPDFTEELAVFLHDEGIPEGEGSDGQSAVIEAVFSRLQARGVREPSRTAVQKVVSNVLRRMRQAE